MKPFRAIPFCAALQLGLFAYGQRFDLRSPAPSSIKKGLVVEQVAKNTQAKRAGVHPGDVLLGWKRGNARGEFDSPFDLSYVFLEQASRGPITILALRGNERIEWLLGSDAWGMSTRPNLSEPFLSIYLRGEELFAAGRVAEATDHLRTAVTAAHQTDTPWLGPWFLYHAGRILAGTKQWDLADAVYQETIAQAEEAPPIVKAELFRQRASAFANHHDLANASKYYRNALEEARKLGSKTMIESNCLLSLAIIELQQGDYENAREHLHYAMAIGEAFAPTGIQTLLTVANLAVLYQDEGQLEKAEAYYLKALDKEEKYFPRSVHLEGTLNDLGVLFDQEGDLARAEAYHRKALSVAEHLDPDGLDVADILANLAECLLEQGNAARAETYQRRALYIRDRVVPESLSGAQSIAGLGKIARIRGDLSKAEDYYRRALGIAAKVDAPGRERARFLIGLAAVLREKRDMPAAEQAYREALTIIEREDPGNIDRASTLGELAGTAYAQNRMDEAAKFYQQALSTFEDRALHIGSVREARSRYRGEHIRYCQEYMRLLIEQGQPELAFEVLEGSRARTLFEMLAQAHVDVAKSADPALSERKRRLEQYLNAKSEHRIRLAESGHADQQLTEIDGEIDDLLFQYQELEAKLRASSPVYSALTQPPLLKVPDIQKLLGSDTLLLEYSLGGEQSYVWAVTDRSLVAYKLPKRTEIEKAARRVRELLTVRNRSTRSGGASDQPNPETDYWAVAMRLSRIALGPVSGILKGKRLLIVSDGALQYIPFSALPSPGSPTNAEPLVLRHAIVNLPSASVLAELRRQVMGRPRAPRMVAVLADPVFDPKDERVRAAISKVPSPPHAPMLYDNDLTRSAKDVGLTKGGRAYLDRLLYTRNEAEAVMAVTPPGKGMEALDFQASRATATSAVLAKYRILHFATHGILNSKHPELSGLVLSLVDRLGRPQNGFLKLQDIYNLKLPVDLVVLSGCETGLGEEIHGEGLISLTRGFMYAGASRVVASLWSVSDMATASLMADFYRAMERDGMRPAAALRQSQIQMWKQKQWNSPYYWAAFQIQGEWQ